MYVACESCVARDTYSVIPIALPTFLYVYISTHLSAGGLPACAAGLQLGGDVPAPLRLLSIDTDLPGHLSRPSNPIARTLPLPLPLPLCATHQVIYHGLLSIGVMLSNPLGTALRPKPKPEPEPNPREPEPEPEPEPKPEPEPEPEPETANPNHAGTDLIDFPGSFYQHVMKSQLSGFAKCVDAHKINLKAGKPKGATITTASHP